MAKKKGGIGATGSAKARFFHPSQAIREQWPNVNQTIRLSGVLLVGKGVHRVNRKDQMCYECRLEEIENVLFHIVCSNFRVDTDPATPFEDEVAGDVLPATRQQETERDRAIELRDTERPRRARA